MQVWSEKPISRDTLMLPTRWIIVNHAVVRVNKDRAVKIVWKAETVKKKVRLRRKWNEEVTEN